MRRRRFDLMIWLWFVPMFAIIALGITATIVLAIG